LLRLVAGLALLVLVAAGAGYWLLRNAQSAPARSYTLVTSGYGPLTAVVSAAGQIEPEQTASLTFATTSQVSEVLVRPGDSVQAGQALARADDRELRLRVVQAEAALRQARANAERVRAGATQAELAAAAAQVDQARGQLAQVLGGVTETDLQAARAQLQQAQAALAKLAAGPAPTDLQVAEARVRDAELTLQAQRDQLSAAKTNAQSQLQQATNALTQAQSRYATAKQNWDYVQATGSDPLTRRVPDTSQPGQTRANTLNDSQRQQYYDAFVQSEAALRTAESNVAQAQVAYDNARQAEVSGVERAEGQTQIAQAQRDQLLAGAGADQIAAAQAQVAAARANLAKLGGDQRAGAVQAAQAALRVAELKLEQLQTGALPTEIETADAQVQNAEAALDLAQLALSGATLTAPFAAQVAEVNLQVGELPGPAEPAVMLTDLSQFHVDVTVDEVDISRLGLSQPVTLTLDALLDLALGGQVESIAPLAITQSAVTSYQVRIAIRSTDARIRPGMTANADIVVAQRGRALLVPRRAVRIERGRLLIDQVDDPTLCAAPREQLPEQPARTAREVRLGLSNDQVVEIVDGLEAGACVYVEGVDVRFNLLSGPPGRGGR
jgi:HlyD family secretion protein